MRTLDLFAGAGGWDVAALRLGWPVDRVENWGPANATANAAGLHTIHSDVATFHTGTGTYDVLIASPPCQTYSMAGSGEGRRNLDRVLTAVRETHDLSDLDTRTGLVLEPLRIALEARPWYIAWEQVPAVLPVWEACAEVLREHGYSVATGILNAEQYGVPQTRRRAVLMARLYPINPATLPTPTHSRYHTRDPKRLDSGVKPWVSMGEALDWSGEVEAVSNYGTGGDPKNRGVRHQDEPFSTITSKTDRVRWRYSGSQMAHGTQRDLDQPAPTVYSQRSANQTWKCPGESIKVTAEQAACLQTFPAGYPFQGNKGQIFQQIGNAVPPRLAEAILTALMG